MTQNTQLPLLPVSQAVADPHTQGDRERQYQLAAAELMPPFFYGVTFQKILHSSSGLALKSERVHKSVLRQREIKLPATPESLPLRKTSTCHTHTHTQAHDRH